MTAGTLARRRAVFMIDNGATLKRVDRVLNGAGKPADVWTRDPEKNEIIGAYLLALKADRDRARLPIRGLLPWGRQ